MVNVTTEPLWYEVTVEAGGRHIETFVTDDFEEALADALDLTKGHMEEQDLGSWKVLLLPHWCDQNGDCECAVYHVTLRPFAEYMGMTIDFDR